MFCITNVWSMSRNCTVHILWSFSLNFNLCMTAISIVWDALSYSCPWSLIWVTSNKVCFLKLKYGTQYEAGHPVSYNTHFTVFHWNILGRFTFIKPDKTLLLMHSFCVNIRFHNHNSYEMMNQSVTPMLTDSLAQHLSCSY